MHVYILTISICHYLLPMPPSVPLHLHHCCVPSLRRNAVGEVLHLIGSAHICTWAWGYPLEYGQATNSQDTKRESLQGQ